MTFKIIFSLAAGKNGEIDVEISYIFITIFLMSLQFVEFCVNI